MALENEYKTAGSLEPPQEPGPSSPPPAPKFRPALAVAGLGVALAGILCIYFSARWEAANQRDQPWGEAVFVPDGTPFWEDTLRARVRKVPLNNFPNWEQIHNELVTSLGALKTRCTVSSNWSRRNGLKRMFVQPAWRALTIEWPGS